MDSSLKGSQGKLTESFDKVEEKCFKPWGFSSSHSLLEGDVVLDTQNTIRQRGRQFYKLQKISVWEKGFSVVKIAGSYSLFSQLFYLCSHCRLFALQSLCLLTLRAFGDNTDILDTWAWLGIFNSFPMHFAHRFYI